MLKLKIEWRNTGPLSDPQTRQVVEAAVEASKTISEVAERIQAIAGLGVYISGRVVAIHGQKGNEMSITRWAIVTDERED